MTTSDRQLLYKTLNHCTQALNEEVATGTSAVYVTIDRLTFNSLLKEIAEAKKALVRPDAEDSHAQNQETRSPENVTW
jgi:hypothetical protein